MDERDIPGATPPQEDEPKTRRDVPDSGEIEWARGFIPNPPAPGEAEATPDSGRPKDPA